MTGQPRSIGVLSLIVDIMMNQHLVDRRREEPTSGSPAETGFAVCGGMAVERTN